MQPLLLLFPKSYIFLTLTIVMFGSDAPHKKHTIWKPSSTSLAVQFYVGVTAIQLLLPAENCMGLATLASRRKLHMPQMHMVFRCLTLNSPSYLSQRFSCPPHYNTHSSLSSQLNLPLLFVFFWVKGISVSWVLPLGGHHQCMFEEPLISKISQLFVNNFLLLSIYSTLTSRRKLHLAQCMFRCLSFQSPPYLSKLFSYSYSHHKTRSSSTAQLNLPQSRPSLGQKSFSFSGASLPPKLHMEKDFTIFQLCVNSSLRDFANVIFS